jgi:hypothetical protein
VARARNGNRRRTYRSALDVHDQSRLALTVDDMLPFVDARTARQHEVLMGVADRLDAGGTPLIEPVPHPQGHLDLRPIVYRHATVAGADQPAGIIGPGVVVDVPDPLDHPDREKAEANLARWNVGRETVLVVNDADLDLAAATLLKAIMAARRA